MKPCSHLAQQIQAKQLKQLCAKHKSLDFFH